MTDFTASRALRFNSAERVESGAGKLKAIPRILKRYGALRLVIATSASLHSKTPYARDLLSLVAGYPLEVFPRCRQHSPESDIEDLRRLLADHRADTVVSIGGSSVFDTAKIAISRNAGASGAPIRQIAIPTTLSAGEFTAGAGYTEEATRTKKLVLDDRVAPRCVVLDPEVTLETPLELWLSSGVKALDHALEALWSLRPHPYADTLALEALRLLWEYLPRSRDRSDLEARGACQMAAWMSISAAGAAGMRLSHFLGHQIGARMHISHGLTSCVLLPAVMRHLRDQTLTAQGRIAEAIGASRTGASREKQADRAADVLEAFISGLGLPTSVRAVGATVDDIDAITVASFEAAKELGLADDLPEGSASIRKILLTS